MDLALPGILIILGIVPGILFFYTYYSGPFPRQISGVSPIQEVGLYLVLSLPLGTVAVWVITAFVEPAPDLNLAQALLGEGDALNAVATAAVNEWKGVVGGYFAVLVGSVLLGSIVRRLVWMSRLDIRSPMLRMKSEWYYRLNGRVVGIPRWFIVTVADVLTESQEGTHLYRGLVFGNEPGPEGKIGLIVLEDCDRGRGRGDDFEWREVPGDRFLILGHTVHSINLQYVQVDEPSGLWERLYLLARSFFLQEP